MAFPLIGALVATAVKFVAKEVIGSATSTGVKHALTAKETSDPDFSKSMDISKKIAREGNFT